MLILLLGPRLECNFLGRFLLWHRWCWWGRWRCLWLLAGGLTTFPNTWLVLIVTTAVIAGVVLPSSSTAGCCQFLLGCCFVGRWWFITAVDVVIILSSPASYHGSLVCFPASNSLENTLMSHSNLSRLPNGHLPQGRSHFFSSGKLNSRREFTTMRRRKIGKLQVPAKEKLLNRTNAE